MKKIIISIAVLALSGCAAPSYQQQVYYNPPPGVVYISPYYPAPSIHWHWVYSHRNGWGWYHRNHGFHQHYRR